MTGLAFVPRLGIQNDEAAYAAALLPPRGEEYALHIGHYSLPLMLMSYLGTLKAVLYRQMIRWFGTGVWATRVPMLLAGAASVWLLYGLLRRVAGERAASVGCCLLAADSMYLLTTCFDWGPVALQHLLIGAGMFLLIRFWQDGRESAWTGGFFLLGLAMWDKALAAWILGGMGVAGLLLFPRQIRRVLTPRRVALAFLAVALGALPLIVYNVNTGWGTFHGTVSYDTSSLPHKALILLNTFTGGGLIGFMTNEDAQTPRPHRARTLLERVSAALAWVTGNPRTSLMFYGFCLALLLAPLARGVELRAILFALVALTVAWWQMAVTANAGGSLHHSILLWPLPQVVMGISFAAASRRLGRAGVPVLALTLAVLACSSLAVTNEYYTLLVRNGGAINWTDAIFPLSNYLKTARASEVLPVDWGIMDSLRLLNRGRLQLRIGFDPISKPELTGEDRQHLDEMVSRPDRVFLAHTAGMEFFEGVSDRLVRYAETRGYKREMITTISDSNGRPTFEVYHFVPN